MNKKSYLRTIAYTLLGAVFGFIISFLLRTFVVGNTVQIKISIENMLSSNIIYLQIALIVLFVIPTITNFIRGSKLLNSLENISDEEAEELEKRGKKLLDITLTTNMTFVFLSFTLFGLSFSNELEARVMIISLILFMLSFISVTIIEFKTIRVIQNSDTRIKGDPSRLSFQKEFLESCDEAEQFQIYKSAYKSYQFTKNISIVSLVIAILGNMILDTGMLPILLTSTILLSLILSYSIDSIRQKA